MSRIPSGKPKRFTEAEWFQSRSQEQPNPQSYPTLITEEPHPSPPALDAIHYKELEITQGNPGYWSLNSLDPVVSNPVKAFHNWSTRKGQPVLDQLARIDQSDLSYSRKGQSGGLWARSDVFLEFAHYRDLDLYLFLKQAFLQREIDHQVKERVAAATAQFQQQLKSLESRAQRALPAPKQEYVPKAAPNRPRYLKEDFYHVAGWIEAHNLKVTGSRGSIGRDVSDFAKAIGRYRDVVFIKTPYGKYEGYNAYPWDVLQSFPGWADYIVQEPSAPEFSEFPYPHSMF